jgi:iron uptake system EfeUOB component EfeO/EfeM
LLNIWKFEEVILTLQTKTITTMKTALEKLQKQLQNSTQEELDKEWEELKEWNEIGPSVEKYVQEIRELN